MDISFNIVPAASVSAPSTKRALQPSTPSVSKAAPPPAAAPTQAAATANPAVPSGAEVKRITEELQRRVSALAPELAFSVDESSGQTIIKFMDPKTNTVVQQFPSEALLQIGKALDQFQKGLLLNRKA